jgi:DNA-binding Lrp family transcriptional regulator
MLDQTDRMLLALLKEDARRKYSELGEAVHLSPPAVHERVKKLERVGTISRYTIEIDPERLGLALPTGYATRYEQTSGDVERRSRVESHSWCGILRGC